MFNTPEHASCHTFISERQSTDRRHSDGDTSVFFESDTIQPSITTRFSTFVWTLDIKTCIFTNLNIQIPARFLRWSTTSILKENQCVTKGSLYQFKLLTSFRRSSSSLVTQFLCEYWTIEIDTQRTTLTNSSRWLSFQARVFTCKQNIGQSDSIIKLQCIGCCTYYATMFQIQFLLSFQLIILSMVRVHSSYS